MIIKKSKRVYRSVLKKQTKFVGNKLTLDRKLLMLALSFTLIGLVAIADSSAPLALKNFSDKYFFVKQQAIWALIGIFAMFLVSFLNYKFWEKIATPFFFASVLGLFLVFIPGLGSEALGARRWISFGEFTLQPSEFIKLSLAVYIAKVSAKGMRTSAYFLPLIITAGLIMLQPDLGTTMVIVVASLIQIFVSGLNLFHFLLVSFVGILGAFLLTLTSDYRRDRFLTFLKQTGDPLGKGYHIRQILLALGSGGLTGVGLGRSRQKYLFLPETATDSIFAVIAEEIGFIGASLLIALFVFFIIRGINIALRAPDKFSSVLATGIVSWIGIQTFFNIGSMVALVPLTGVPLPFISYGGSALVTILVACGILLNISRYEQK